MAWLLLVRGDLLLLLFGRGEARSGEQHSSGIFPKGFCCVGSEFEHVDLRSIAADRDRSPTPTVRYLNDLLPDSHIDLPVMK